MSEFGITINPGSSATFDPDPQIVFENDSVFWFNDDQNKPHWPSLIDEPIAPGSSSSPVGFPTAKTIDYVCNLHPNESGQIIVKN
jgi:hypothetical protein